MNDLCKHEIYSSRLRAETSVCSWVHKARGASDELAHWISTECCRNLGGCLCQRAKENEEVGQNAQNYVTKNHCRLTTYRGVPHAFALRKTAIIYLYVF